jgi:hypothetical protein
MTNYEDDVLDERGLLRDGKRIRIPLTLMDGLSRSVAEHFTDTRTTVVDGLGRPAGNRPGAVYLRTNPHTTDHAVAVTQRVMADKARREWIDEMTNAWKNKPEDDPDPFIRALAGTDREVARLHNTGNPVADAYADSILDLTTSWSRGR